MPLKRIAFLHSSYWLFPSYETSVPNSEGHSIVVSLVQQEDCGKGHTIDVSGCMVQLVSLQLTVSNSQSRTSTPSQLSNCKAVCGVANWS